MNTIFDSLTAPSEAAGTRQEFLNDINQRLLTGRDKIGALLIVNIRHLRDINISLGSTIADELLAQFGDHLQTQLRPSDFSVHLGGDEFGVFIFNIPGAPIAELAASKIHNSIKPGLVVCGQEVPLRLNIGIATYPEHGDNADSLFRNALSALSVARKTEQPSRLFEASLHSRSIDILAMRKSLRTAIDTGGLELYFQPKINLTTNQISGAETLMRWNHPETGHISPEIFIPVAEQSDLIEPLSFWSINAALRQCSICRQKFDCLNVAVNLSANVLHHPHLVDIVQRSMNIWGTPPGNLILEVTESAMMRDPVASLNTLHALNEVGITLSIDDFGTGYSSFSYLKKLPIRELKIDKSFVLHMHEDKSDENIVRAIIDLSHNLGVSVVAEGVENQKTFDKLRQIGCDYAQGYYISKPLPPDDLAQWIMDSPWAVNRKL